MTIVRTTVDLTEYIVGDRAECHLFPRSGLAPFAYCGVPRSEQPFHVVPVKTAPTCGACGLPRCPICLQGHLANRTP